MGKQAKQKFYVVWRGISPGVYTTWPITEAQVKGVPGSLYKSFSTREEAEEAFRSEPSEAMSRTKGKTNKGGRQGGGRPYVREKIRLNDLPDSPSDYRNDTVLPLPMEVEAQAWAVDAACSGNPGMMEYRGVCLQTGAVLFHLGPMFGTNNIGEFLAIVHAMALMERDGKSLTIYSDSVNAMKWVKAGKCKTTLVRNKKSEPVYELIARAESWLANHSFRPTMKKWETQLHGDIPADFGRKG